MSLLVSDEELAYIHSLTMAQGLQPLSRQQERFLMYYFRGASVAAAARVAGAKPSVARGWLETEVFKQYLDFLVERECSEIRVTRDVLTRMLFDAHDTADTSMAKINAVKELGKMHDIYPKQEVVAPTVVINQVTEQTLKQLERLTDEQLADLAGPVVIEGTTTDE